MTQLPTKSSWDLDDSPQRKLGAQEVDHSRLQGNDALGRAMAQAHAVSRSNMSSRSQSMVQPDLGAPVTPMATGSLPHAAMNHGMGAAVSATLSLPAGNRGVMHGASFASALSSKQDGQPGGRASSFSSLHSVAMTRQDSEMDAPPANFGHHTGSIDQTQVAPPNLGQQRASASAFGTSPVNNQAAPPHDTLGSGGQMLPHAHTVATHDAFGSNGHMQLGQTISHQDSFGSGGQTRHAQTLPPHDIFNSGGQMRLGHTITPQDSFRSDGQVRLGQTVSPHDVVGASGQKWHQASPGPAAGGGHYPASTPAGYPSANGHLQSGRQDPGAPMAQNEPPQASNRTGLVGCHLRGFIFGATNLRNADLGILPTDVSDPFLVARLGRHVVRPNGKREFVAGRQEFKTEVVDNNLNPVWSRNTFSFVVENDDDQVLRVEIFSANTYVHDTLGEIEWCLKQDLQAGQSRRFKQMLHNGDGGEVEVELRLLTPQAVARGETGGPSPFAGPQAANGALMPMRTGAMAIAGGAQGKHDFSGFGHFHADIAAAMSVRKMQDHKVQNKVPLPDFRSMGKEAFEAPPPKRDVAPVGEMRKKAEYVSLACHLGQYNYGSEPVYYPKQDDVDKGQWQADPFYGWRGQDDDGPSLRGPGGQSARNVLVERNDGLDVELWSRDPFHGWLKHGKDGYPDKSPPDGKTLALEQSRTQAGLPSFAEVPKKRFEDHREYVNLHELDTRGRPGDAGHAGYRAALDLPEHQWKNDAFYGWLPKRGPPSEEKHLMHRPLEQARLVGCPSFSEQAVNGLRGFGIGVLKVWVNSAADLSYAEGGYHSRPNACVKLRLGGQQSGAQEQMTDTVAPRPGNVPVWEWNSAAYRFEIEEVSDRLTFECWDLVGQRDDGTHQHQYFLGRCELEIESVLAQYEQAAQAARVNSQIRESKPLQTSSTSGRPLIEYTYLFEPYNSDSARKVERQRAMARCIAQPPMQGNVLGQTVASVGPMGDSQMGVGSMGLGSTGAGSMRAGSMGIMTARGLSHAPSMVSDRTSLGVLSVQIIAAYDLVNADSGLFGDVSDPYVTLRLKSQSEKQRKRTPTISNNLNPRWNCSPYLFQIQHESDSLILEVYDDDQAKFKADDFIGAMTIPLYDFIRRPNQKIHVRDHLSNVEHGELEVEIGFLPD